MFKIRILVHELVLNYACYFFQSDIRTPAPKDTAMAEQSVRDGGEQQQDARENTA